MPNTGFATRPFCAKVPKAHLDYAIRNAARTGVHYGYFFTSSGEYWYERINPGRQYPYAFRTDGLEDTSVRIPIPATDGGVEEWITVVVAGTRVDGEEDLLLSEEALRTIDKAKQDRIEYLRIKEKTR